MYQTYKYSYIRCLVVKRRSVKQEYRWQILSNSDEKYPSESTKTYIDAAVASGVVDASNKKREAETSWRYWWYS
jgi:hypothetical protein